MAAGPSNYLVNSWLNALGNATSFSVTTVYVQLHVGSPGSAGTTNVATETTRKAVSYATAANGILSSDAAITWTSIAGSQDATHFSLWDASTSGNFLGSGDITANSYTAGDTFTIASGDLDIDMAAARAS